MNNWIQVSFQLFFSQCICPVFLLLGHLVVLILVFKGISLVFSMVAISISFPTFSVNAPQHLLLVQFFFACTIFDDGHSDLYEVTPHCNFYHDERCCSPFHVFMCVLPLCISLLKEQIQD